MKTTWLTFIRKVEKLADSKKARIIAGAVVLFIVLVVTGHYGG